MFPPMTPMSERIRERREMDNMLTRDPELLAIEREHWLSQTLVAIATRLRNQRPAQPAARSTAQVPAVKLG